MIEEPVRFWLVFDFNPHLGLLCRKSRKLKIWIIHSTHPHSYLTITFPLHSRFPVCTTEDTSPRGLLSWPFVRVCSFCVRTRFCFNFKIPDVLLHVEITTKCMYAIYSMTSHWIFYKLIFFTTTTTKKNMFQMLHSSNRAKRYTEGSLTTLTAILQVCISRILKEKYIIYCTMKLFLNLFLCQKSILSSNRFFFFHPNGWKRPK